MLDNDTCILVVESIILCTLYHFCCIISLGLSIGPIIVQCCQTGKKLNVRVKDVTTEDCQSLTESDFVSGANLILNHKGKSYPVQFVEFKGKSIVLFQREYNNSWLCM